MSERDVEKNVERPLWEGFHIFFVTGTRSLPNTVIFMDL